MAGLQLENITPGAIVFGRVYSFPWWPAIVGRCPSSGEWKDGEDRRWVFFFNDRNGAWLKFRDMRPFDAFTRESLSEVNTRNPKHRKHLERIEKAFDFAEEYIRNSGTTRALAEFNRNLTYSALTISPPPGDEICDTPSPRAAADHPGNTLPSRANTVGGSKVAQLFGVLPLKRRRRSSAPPVYDPEFTTLTARPAAEQDAMEPEMMANGQRPRRKRKKSTRYEGFDNPFESRRGRSTRQVQEDVKVLEQQKPESTPSKIPPLRLALQRKEVQPNGSSSTGRQGVNVGVTAADKVAAKSWTSESEVEMEEKQGNGKAVTVDKKNKLLVRINGRVVTRGQKALSSSAKPGPSNKPPKKTDLKTKKTVKKVQTRRWKAVNKPHITDPCATASSESEIEPVEDEILPANGHTLRRTSLPSNFRTPFRPRENDPFRRNINDDSSTDTDDNADQVRLLANPEELRREKVLDDAIQRMLATQATDTAPIAAQPQHPQVPPGPLCMAEGELIHSMLNRVRSLEAHVMSLQAKVGEGNGVVLGEDASAAALKAAVETLIRTANDFARCRQYDAGIIARSVDTLWAEPELGDVGARTVAREEEFVRSVARTLVWTAFQNNVGTKTEK